jgi:hypothetical protein
MSQGLRGRSRGRGGKLRMLPGVHFLNLFFFWLFELIDQWGASLQPERQFPKNPGPRRGANTPSGAIRGFPLLPRFPRNPWDIVACFRVRRQSKKTAPRGAVWLNTDGRAKSCYSRSIELPKL